MMRDVADIRGSLNVRYIEAHTSDDLNETSNAHCFMFGNTFIITFCEHRSRAARGSVSKVINCADAARANARVAHPQSRAIKFSNHEAKAIACCLPRSIWERSANRAAFPHVF